MNIFDATLKLKDHTYKGNPQLIEVKGDIELSGMTPMTLLYYDNQIKKPKDYLKKVKKLADVNFLYNKDFYITIKGLNDNDLLIKNSENLSPNTVNTKEYWTFLHENFPFCDVCSYYNVIDLDSYFGVKGKHYDSIVDRLGIDFFKNKKILEIGPGYGYLAKLLKSSSIPHEYFCADLVKRFEHDNFIEVDGYNLNITEKFDIIIMVDVIQHLGYNILKNYMEEISNMLNPNGSFLISTEMKAVSTHYGSFFGQIYENMGLKDIHAHMIGLNFNLQPLKYFLPNLNGKILEFKI